MKAPASTRSSTSTIRPWAVTVEALLASLAASPAGLGAVEAAARRGAAAVC